jgi:hypothetical protein
MSEWSRGDARDIDGQNREVEWAGAHESMRATSEFQLGEAGLELFDNGDRGSGRHGREARRVSEWEFVNQFLRR